MTVKLTYVFSAARTSAVNFSSLGAFKRCLQLINFDEFLRYSLID